MELTAFTQLATLFSRSSALDLLRLLTTSIDISASEAASRLDLHVKTVQDWLEGMHAAGMLRREEVSEGQRPYFRYALAERQVIIELDFNELNPEDVVAFWRDRRVREKKNSNCRFVTSARLPRIASVAIVSGSGRDTRERKLNLSPRQGLFLYHLPFPTANAQNVQEIMDRAGLDSIHQLEVIDLVAELVELDVVEVVD